MEGPFGRRKIINGEDMIIMVMDGQGGGIGSTIIKGLREIIVEEVEILAIRTNSIATLRMMRTGANRKNYQGDV